MATPAGVTLQQIDGGANYYANNGFTYAANAGWDNPKFFPIGPWEGFVTDQTDVDTFKALDWNTSFNVTGNSSPQLALANGIWLIQNASDGILAGTGAETVGLLSADENYSASVNAVETTPNSIQNNRFWWLQNTWSTLLPNAYISYNGSDIPMAQIMSQELNTPNGTQAKFNVLSADLYWFSGSKDGGVLDEGGQIYGLPGPMTVAQGARGSNYGDMIDIERSYMTADPGPIFSFIEVGEPGNSPSATAADYITPPELNWAVWSSLIHGARGIIYFNNTFTGPAQDNNDVENAYYQTVQPGQSISIYAQIKNTDALTEQLAPVLNSPFALNYTSIRDDDPQDAGLPNYTFGRGPDLVQGGLEVMTKDYNGQFYIFADTRDPETETNIQATFTIADVKATSVTAVGENRTIPVVNGVFTDTFASAATVHIYEVNDGGSAPASPPPVAPVIGAGVPNATGSVTLTGTAPGGSTVAVSDDGGAVALGTTTASTTGTWTYTTAALAAGTYAFTATDSTSAGTSAASSAFDVTVTGSSSSTGSSPPPSGSNLVGNGNFATGDFTDWTVGGNSGLTPAGQQIDIEANGEGGSTYAAKIGSMGADGTLSQTITTTPGQTYTLTFWLQNEASGTQNNDFKAIWNGQTLLSLTNAAQSGYTEYTYTVTATSSTSTLEFSAANVPSQWDLDNISLTAAASTTATPPTAPVISTGVANANKSVTLTGTAPAGSTVTVSDGTPLGSTTASSIGTWSYTTPDLAAGTYVFTATDSTSAGTSAASSAFDVTVTSSPSSTGSSPPPSGSNLVGNGNFATGDFTDWTVGGNSGLTPAGQQIDIEANGEGGSTYAAKIGSMGADGTLSQTITTTPGQTYTLTFWLQNEASGTQDNDFKAIWNGQTLLSLTNAAQSGYTEYTYTVTATSSASTLEFSAANVPSQWDLDNISLTAAASTTTAAATASEPTTVGNGATVEISAPESGSVTFAASTGTLKLDNPSTFAGKIQNFTGNGTLSGSDQIDLTNINFTSAKASYANGVLTVSDGKGDTDQLTFNGSHTLANFKLATDGSGGTIVYDPPVPPSSSGAGGRTLLDAGSTDVPAIAFDPQTTLGYLPNRQPTGGTLSLTDGTHSSNIASLGSYMASSFAMVGDNHGGTIVAGEAMQSHHPLLAGPQHG